MLMDNTLFLSLYRFVKFTVKRKLENANEIDINRSIVMNTRVATDISDDIVDKKPQNLHKAEFFQ